MQIHVAHKRSRLTGVCPQRLIHLSLCLISSNLIVYMCSLHRTATIRWLKQHFNPEFMSFSKNQCALPLRRPINCWHWHATTDCASELITTSCTPELISVCGRS